MYLFKLDVDTLFAKRNLVEFLIFIHLILFVPMAVLVFFNTSHSKGGDEGVILLCIFSYLLFIIGEPINFITCRGKHLYYLETYGEEYIQLLKKELTLSNVRAHRRDNWETWEAKLNPDKAGELGTSFVRDTYIDTAKRKRRRRRRANRK